MDPTEQVKKFEEFLEQNYLAKLLENARKGLNSLTIDFGELSKFDPELADELLDYPEDVIKAAEIAVMNFDLPEEIKKFRIRVSNLSSAQDIMIKDIRSKHINKVFKIIGVVRQKSDVRPQVTTAKFECPSCGNVISVLQLETSFKEPTRCSCGRKGKFILAEKDLVDAQGIVLEEAPEMLEGGAQPKRMNVILKDDLVSPISDRKTNPGNKIIINGIVKEVPIILRTGGTSTRFDLMIEGNYIEPVDEDFSDIQISEEEQKEINDLAQDKNIFKRLAQSIAPSIYGHEKVKEALILQLFGGVKKTRPDGMVTRGDMHTLLVGDPGAGKSQLLKLVSAIAPKARWVTGKGATGAGLTAAVVKDEFLKGWSLEAGALVLANRGFCMIDELDKMGKEDRSAMHEALEQQTVTISKANIQATLRAETSVLAAANPKFGRFDPYGNIADQIDLPMTLVNRFDLIFPIRDIPDKERDEVMAKFILMLHQAKITKEPEISPHLLRKYISYARQTCRPELTDVALEEIKEYYVKMRSSGIEEGRVTAIPISARQLEALVRLAEASAKTRLSDKVTKKDSKKAIELVHYCLSQIGIDPETGKIDIDRISTGVTASQRSKIITIKDIISELEAKLGKNNIHMEAIVKEAGEKGIDEETVEEVIEKLKRSGDIFEPRRGFIQKI
ncbi:minichromosome maintenance protein MCM [Candidatus Woesearchaeota archaeon]|nr:minichromosome maintenance protein MCM [Candidatus Woesearchaeota archaeon]